MKYCRIWNFILFAGLLSGSCRCVEVIENELGLMGHKSGIYIHQSDKPTNINMKGVEAMFQEIDDKTAIYAIFEYDNNNRSASIAKKMLETALKTKPTKVNWKSFLETEIAKIETEAQAESSTRALVVVVDGNTVTTAQVGLTPMTVFFKDSMDSKTLNSKSMSDNLSREQLHNVLGGMIGKGRHANIHEHVVVTQLNDPKFIVMGTTSLWRADDYVTAKLILKNEKDYRKAAKAIANIRNSKSAMKTDYGVIIIALQKGINFRSIIRSISNCVKF